MFICTHIISLNISGRPFSVNKGNGLRGDCSMARQSPMKASGGGEDYCRWRVARIGRVGSKTYSGFQFNMTCPNSMFKRRLAEAGTTSGPQSRSLPSQAFRENAHDIDCRSLVFGCWQLVQVVKHSSIDQERVDDWLEEVGDRHLQGSGEQGQVDRRKPALARLVLRDGSLIL